MEPLVSSRICFLREYPTYVHTEQGFGPSFYILGGGRGWEMLPGPPLPVLTDYVNAHQGL